MNGVPIPILQKLLGHKNIRTTAFYWKGSIDVREFGGWLEFPNKQPEPDKTLPVKISNNYQLPKIRRIPVQLERPNLNSSQESENLKTIVRLKGELAEKNLVIMEKDRKILSKDKQISLLTNEIKSLKAINQQKNQHLKELQEKVKEVAKENNSLIQKC